MSSSPFPLSHHQHNTDTTTTAVILQAAPHQPPAWQPAGQRCGRRGGPATPEALGARAAEIVQHARRRRSQVLPVHVPLRQVRISTHRHRLQAWVVGKRAKPRLQIHRQREDARNRQRLCLTQYLLHHGIRGLIRAAKQDAQTRSDKFDCLIQYLWYKGSEVGLSHPIPFTLWNPKSDFVSANTSITDIMESEV